MTKFDDSDGVWRTIGGRRVFIKDGQSLSDAMKESGKFKKKGEKTSKDASEDQLKRAQTEYKDVADLRDEYEDKVLSKADEEDKKEGKLKQNNDAKNYYSKLSEKEIVQDLEERKNRLDNDFYDKKDKEMYQKFYDEGKKYYDEKYKQGKDELRQAVEEQARKTGNIEPVEDRLTNNMIVSHYGNQVAIRDKDNNLMVTDRAQYNDYVNGKIDKLGGEFVSNDEKALREMIAFEGLDKYPYKGYVDDEKTGNDQKYKEFVDSEYNKLKDRVIDTTNAKSERAKTNENYQEKTTNDYMNDKIRKGASKNKDDLPKRTEIKEQGTSNRKEVSENIQAHILDYYTPDYTGDDNVSAQDAFIRQMEAMGESNMWNAGKRIAEGGSYLIYNGDMADFLNELKINPKGKTFSEDKAFDMYTSLIGRESAKLYDRLKKNAYKAYLKEHPNSNMSFEDFKDMRK